MYKGWAVMAQVRCILYWLGSLIMLTSAALSITPEWTPAILGKNPNIIMELTMGQRQP